MSERIAGGYRIGQPQLGAVYVDSQQLAQHRLRVLAVSVGVAGTATIARADVQVAVRSKRQHAPVVIVARVRNREEDDATVRIGHVWIGGDRVAGYRIRLIRGCVINKELTVGRVVWVKRQSEQPLLRSARGDQPANVEKWRRQNVTVVGDSYRPGSLHHKDSSAAIAGMREIDGLLEGPNRWNKRYLNVRGGGARSGGNANSAGFGRWPSACAAEDDSVSDDGHDEGRDESKPTPENSVIVLLTKPAQCSEFSIYGRRKRKRSASPPRRDHQARDALVTQMCTMVVALSGCERRIKVPQWQSQHPADIPWPSKHLGLPLVERIFFSIGSALAFLGVAAGAFGAHGLRGRVANDMLEVFETAARYHIYHALGLLAVAWAASRWPGAATTAAGWLFLAGVVLFSGSLYLMTFTGARWLGAITPLGGVAFLAGWAALAFAALRAQQ
jgi:uncharacterized membrane protein YgdD (TMEM256/DUF423 family)